MAVFPQLSLPQWTTHRNKVNNRTFSFVVQYEWHSWKNLIQISFIYLNMYNMFVFSNSGGLLLLFILTELARLTLSLSPPISLTNLLF